MRSEDRKPGAAAGSWDEVEQWGATRVEGLGVVERGVEGVCWRDGPFTWACRPDRSGCGCGAGKARQGNAMQSNAASLMADGRAGAQCSG